MVKDWTIDIQSGKFGFDDNGEVYKISPPPKAPTRLETLWKKLLFKLHLRNQYPIPFEFGDGKSRANIIRIKAESQNITPTK